MEQKKSRLLSRDFILSMTAVTGTSFVNYFFFSTLPLYAEKLTGTARYAGFLSLAYSAMALIFRPMTGIISDRHGRVKLIILGAALCTISCVLYSFTTGLILLLLIRILNGGGMSIGATSAGAAIPDIVPEDRLTEGIGIFGLSTTVAQALGPTIALSIVGDGQMSSFNTLFFVAAAFCGVSFICGCFIKYERGMKKHDRPIKNIPEQKQPQITGEGKMFLGIDPRIWSLVVVFMLFFFGYSSVLSYITLFGQVRGFQTRFLGLYFFVSAGGMLLSRLVLGRIADKRGADIVIIPGLIVAAACLAAIPVAPSLPLLIITALPYGIANGALVPAINAAMFKRSSPLRRGSVSAAYYIAVDVGISLGTPVMGYVADYVGFNWVYWLSSLTVLIALLLYIRFASDKRNNQRLQ